MRAVRATLVIPGLFALTFKVIGNPQIALYATFGGFGTLVFAAFGGTRRDKAVAHLMLAVAGSIMLIIGTAVSGITWLAAIVTVAVAFAVFFAAIAGPNAASGVTAVLLAYVLPVASAGTAAEIPSRLAGWWLASAASTAAVLLLAPPSSAGNKLRLAAAQTASGLARCLTAAAEGRATEADREEAAAAKRRLLDLFAASPYRPTGLATADQAMANVVQQLEWCTALVNDELDGHLNLGRLAPTDSELLGAAAALLEDVSWLFGNQEITSRDVVRDIDRVNRARAPAASRCQELSGDPASVQAAAASAADADAIAVVARSVAADALIAAGRADPQTVAAQRRTWYSGRQEVSSVAGRRFAGLPGAARLAGLAGAVRTAARHLSPRSALFRSSVRGALALAVAVTVADVSGLQHAFWVALGTLSVLRTNAASTGSTVWRALVGTVAGFVVGAALLVGIGTAQTALWVALPIAIAVAAYAPGTAPFAVGQAAFTVTIVVLFNLLVPAGWKVGLLRIEDVAIGCAVSLVFGALFWPRGAASVVGDDLADAFRSGAAYLTEAVDWSLGLSRRAPDTAPAIAAGVRLDEALRLFLAEQGTKRLGKEELWHLVMATMRLRLSAISVADLREDGASDGAAEPGAADPALSMLRRRTADLADFYRRVAEEVGPPRHDMPAAPVVAPDLHGIDGPDGLEGLAGSAGPGGAGVAGNGETVSAEYRSRALWVREHLRHLAQRAPAITAPAEHVAELRRVPWWR
jgi:hypothetical protein